MIRFFNTLSGKLEPFRAITDGEVKLYTCGPTVYDYAHIGNFRAYMFEDLLKRFLVFMDYRVTHVMNITDVDDKTINGANAEGVTLQEYTKKYIDSFFEDIDTLRIARADHYPKATEHIPEMVKMIKGLLDKGYAYEKDGSVYFSIAKFPDYGRLSKINLEELKPGERVESDEYDKESANDFALWKHKKEGEPFWETEIGPGRPGWHIECSVMSSKYLGETFDVHCGGTDNMFPHHENEIAQSEAYFGKKFVNYWLHCRHLIVDGEKMSKSKDNFYTMRDMLQKNVNPVVLRFLLLSTHYRKMLNFTFEALDQANASLQRIKDFLYELKNHPFKEGESKAVSKIIDRTRKNFAEGLSDDLNISVALRVLFDMIREVNSLIAKNKVFSQDAEKLMNLIHSIDSVLGVLPEEKEELLPAEITKKIEEREKARKDKDFESADRIRDELLDLGIMLEDTKDRVRWKRVKGKR
ncbi:MAG: cysteine--tRNA ligase [Candidatus Aminicenantes bacterium]|nr:cysteine--tRNA ligase [Candidatus Aminicenantes bacterium]